MTVEEDKQSYPKCRFTDLLECTKNQDCENCIVFWYGYYRDTGEIKDE